MNLFLENATVVSNELALSFSDGFEAYLTLPLLRRSCPCAGCQGEPDAMGRVLRPMVKYSTNSFEIDRVEAIGGYGIQLFWKDGHSTGIYSYSYLKKLSELPIA